MTLLCQIASPPLLADGLATTVLGECHSSLRWNPTIYMDSVSSTE